MRVLLFSMLHGSRYLNVSDPSRVNHPPTHPPTLLLCFHVDDEESDACHLGAVIVRDLSIAVSNYRSTMSLDEYCKKHNVLGISGLDTRALTKVGWPGGVRAIRSDMRMGRGFGGGDWTGAGDYHMEGAGGTAFSFEQLIPC